MARRFECVSSMTDLAKLLIIDAFAELLKFLVPTQEHRNEVAEAIGLPGNVLGSILSLA